MEEKQFYHYMQYFDRDFLLKSKQHAFYLDLLSRRYLEKNLPRKWYFLPLPFQNGRVLNFSFSPKTKSCWQIYTNHQDIWILAFLFLKMRTRGARREKFGIFFSSDLELCFFPVSHLTYHSGGAKEANQDNVHPNPVWAVDASGSKLRDIFCTHTHTHTEYYSAIKRIKSCHLWQHRWT